ncbi:hypothetical protein SAMN05216464_13510 [Mucilaginibacter pineti]|uniref:Uncharacterized protein n=1 Tax=Mucilaginibacter pineti TaxID=1391627 RepID=A0A1G7P616_9SPHI|nr:hypothetical protein [Mucilaginibacter pineti]SDF81671.1 hypothetical protein SAMN05216464_13510 [Mucilaginibacter pineti]
MIKKTGLILLLFLCSCSVSKPVIDNSLIIARHPKPIKVFGIGNWKPGYSVLTLIDADNQYFVITTKQIDTLKKGAIYIK